MVYVNLPRKAWWEEKRVENGTLHSTNIWKIAEEQVPAEEMEKNHPECWKEGWESGAMELMSRENVKKTSKMSKTELSHKMRTTKPLVLATRGCSRFLQQCHSNGDGWQFSILWRLIDCRQLQIILSFGTRNKERQWGDNWGKIWRSWDSGKLRYGESPTGLWIWVQVFKALNVMLLSWC